MELKNFMKFSRRTGLSGLDIINYLNTRVIDNSNLKLNDKDFIKNDQSKTTVLIRRK